VLDPDFPGDPLGSANFVLFNVKTDQPIMRMDEILAVDANRFVRDYPHLEVRDCR
jgi:hypothetical protein